MQVGSLLLGHHRVGGVVGDGAGVRSVLEADETGLAPRGAPGVSDLPVGRGINSGGLDAVVHRLAASRHDTTEQYKTRLLSIHIHTYKKNRERFLPSVTVPAAGVQADGQRAGGLYVGGHGGFASEIML